LRGDAVDVAAQFNLLGELCSTRRTVFGAFIGHALGGRAGELGGGFESLSVHGHRLIS